MAFICCNYWCRANLICESETSQLVGGLTLNYTQASYGRLPPSAIILWELTLHKHGLFKANAGSVNYRDMDSYAQILSIALSDIDGYVLEELAENEAAGGKASLPPSPSKSSGVVEQQTTLQLMHSAIERIHSSISMFDTHHFTNFRLI
jgi:hypothetical protein